MTNTWEEIKNKAKKYSKVSDSALDIYKKISSCGANQFFSIKPTFYLGAAYSSAMDYINYIEKLLTAKEKDFSEFFKLMLYLRECSKNMLAHINSLSEPLELLIQHMEEIYEGEEGGEGEEYEEYEEDEEIEEIDKDGEKIKEDDDKTYSREDFAKQKDDLAEKLRLKLKEVCGSENLTHTLSNVMSLIYLECAQFIREAGRLNGAYDADIDTILTILVDLQFGLEVQLKGYITEDMTKDEEYNFNLGFLVWSAHFLNELTNKLNKEVTVRSGQ